MTLFLAIVLLADVAMSIRPMAFIRACLSGVNLPENFWWVLLVIKTLAAAGLIADHWLADAGYAGVGLAATVGVVVWSRWVLSCYDQSYRDQSMTTAP